MAELDKAIAFMNTGTIAHMDLRPANIMWQERDGNAVIMKIIDFELSVIFSHSICPEWIELILSTNDYRYPFRVGDEQRRQATQFILWESNTRLAEQSNRKIQRVHA